MKPRNYSLLLIILWSLLFMQVSAQSTDSIRALDSMISRTRKDLDLKAQELRELQKKKADLNRQNSVKMYGDLNGFDKDHMKELFKFKDNINAWTKDLEFNLNLNLGTHLGEIFKNFDLNEKLNRNNDSQKNEKTKTISKSYPVDKDDKLSINNKFGKVTVNTWDKNEIKVDVEIKAYGPTDSRAQESLDNVSIKESKQGNIISFETVFETLNSLNWSSGDRREVNYTIYMPSANALDVKNRYGSTVLPDLNGIINIDEAYGSLTTGNLSNPINNITVKYGGANIGNIKSAVLEVAYGSLTIANAGKIDAKVSYSPVKIEKISGDMDINIRYGDLKIGKVDPATRKINIDASYSSSSLVFDPVANFNFDVKANYGSLNYNKDKVSAISSESSNTKKSYIGKYGNGSDTQVTIRSNYGSIKFQ
jgi:hypothetical protein